MGPRREDLRWQWRFFVANFYEMNFQVLLQTRFYKTFGTVTSAREEHISIKIRYIHGDKSSLLLKNNNNARTYDNVCIEIGRLLSFVYIFSTVARQCC
jgi:hypothetical protein